MPGTGQYRITGAGANMWAKQDQFQYVWREMSGNFTVTATLRFLGQGNEHRKAGIMVRQSLDTDATYADVVIHGNGMPGLQWRSKQGEDTNTFDLPFDGPGTFKVKLVRTGVRILHVYREGWRPSSRKSPTPRFRSGIRSWSDSPCARIRRTRRTRSSFRMFRWKPNRRLPRRKWDNFD